MVILNTIFNLITALCDVFLKLLKTCGKICFCLQRVHVKINHQELFDDVDGRFF